MSAATTPPNPSELIDKFISQLPDKIKLWRFVGKMAIEQVNKRLIDQVDNYSTREPSNPPAVVSEDKPLVPLNDQAPIKVAEKITRNRQPRRHKTKLPIANYDDLSALQILDLLGALSNIELSLIKKYETNHRARKTILSKIVMLSNATK
ncbi:hypothetical protein EMGBS4_19540 [Acidimicrobiaceae bacterium]|nr:hypothetical protein EMGBS4_19540 [Acidimicrobiaceae bacterium]